MIPDPFIIALEDAGNRLLALDPDTLARLARLEGKVIRVECRAPRFELYLCPGADGVRLLRRLDDEPHVVLRGPLSVFLRLGLPGADAMTAARELEIEGDIEVGQQFQRALARLDIDWEEQASRVLGDVVAHRLGNLVRGMAGWGRQAADTLAQDLGEYLQHESRLLPPPEQVEAFMRDVDTLRSDVDRLAARVQRLGD